MFVQIKSLLSLRLKTQSRGCFITHNIVLQLKFQKCNYNKKNANKNIIVFILGVLSFQCINQICKHYHCEGFSLFMGDRQFRLGYNNKKLKTPKKTSQFYILILVLTTNEEFFSYTLKKLQGKWCFCIHILPFQSKTQIIPEYYLCLNLFTVEMVQFENIFTFCFQFQGKLIQFEVKKVQCVFSYRIVWYSFSVYKRV
eukprot:EC097479.1.p1 GENE.EC097479.1~~EC097479.1.p1  ORF type:complete len:198 (+),score=-10.81 EC097479.1:119-712(+)